MNRIRASLYLVSLCMLAIPAMAFGQARQLPFGAFLDVQPGMSYSGWFEPATDRWLYFDVFGKRAESLGLNLGTTIEGRVMVRGLTDGRAQVSVLVQTRNAVCWGLQGDGEGVYMPAFGFPPSQVLQRGASVGDGLMTMAFTMSSPESPLPPVDQIGSPDYPLESIHSVINCSGVLRFGSGFPNGTPGRAHTNQRGLFATGVPSGCPASDCWPAERVDFQPVGN